MAQTDAALLISTREAIDALTTGNVQSYALNGRTVTRLNLTELWDQVNRLEARIARSTRGRFGVAVIRDV